MTKEVQVAIGARLRQARRAARLTQEDVSADFVCSRQAISAWENGHTLPRLHEFSKLATLYGVSTDVLLYGASVQDVADQLLGRLRPAVAPPSNMVDSTTA